MQFAHVSRAQFWKLAKKLPSREIEIQTPSYELDSLLALQKKYKEQFSVGANANIMSQSAVGKAMKAITANCRREHPSKTKEECKTFECVFTVHFTTPADKDRKALLHLHVCGLPDECVAAPARTGLNIDIQ